MRPAFRYHGGKHSMLKWIVTKMPQHKIFVDVFGGAGNIVLNKPAAWLDVYNDINSEVVNFFECLRDDTEALTRAIALTPYSREEYQNSAGLQKAMRQIPLPPHLKISDSAARIERARIFFVVAWQSRGKVETDRSGGWRRVTNATGRHTPPVSDWVNTLENLYLVADRMRRIQFEHKDFREILIDYDGPDTLFYCDPPYLKSTRRSASSNGVHEYAHDMSEEDHREFLTMVQSLKGKVMISGYQSDLYDEYLHEWNRYEYNARVDNHAGNAKEILWVCPKSPAAELFTTKVTAIFQHNEA